MFRGGGRGRGGKRWRVGYGWGMREGWGKGRVRVGGESGSKG